MPFSSYFKDNFIAPEISTFKGVELEDLSCYDDQSPHWLYNYILNMGFSYQIKPFREQPSPGLMPTHDTYPQTQAHPQRITNCSDNGGSGEGVAV